MTDSTPRSTVQNSAYPFDNSITGELYMSDSTFMKILAVLAVVAFVLVVSTPAP
jgi:hypothetical protein